MANWHVPLKSRSIICSSYVRPILLYGVEARSFTKKLEESLQGCDRRMLRFMAGSSLADRVTSIEVESRYSMKPLNLVISETILRWYGHVKSLQGDGVLGEVMEIEVPKTRLRSIPKKIWMKIIEEDMCEWNLME